MTLINNTNSKIIGIKPKMTEDQLSVIEIVKECLAQAVEGNISSIGIVACMPKGYATIVAGRQAADLHMGCASLQLKILNKVERAGMDKMQQ